MPTLNDLPVELILEIIPHVVRFNPYKPILGVNAAWTNLDTYLDSIRDIDTENIDETDPLPPSPVSIHADLLSLRLTSSAFNILCVPFIFAELNLLTDIQLPFEEFYELIVIPYAHHFRTIRIHADTPSLSDDGVSRIVTVSENLNSFMFYHYNFQTQLSADLWSTREDQGYRHFLSRTSRAIVGSLKNGSLNRLGIYSNAITRGEYWGNFTMPNPAIFMLLNLVASDPNACASLQHLEIALYAMPSETYDLIRGQFTSLKSLTIHHAFRPFLGKFWSPDQIAKWSPNANLTHLKLRKSAPAYAPHIPNIVRHFVSLRFLLVSVCGYNDDMPMQTPPKGWHSASKALWRVRKPLDVFHLEHEDYWELGVMGEIPTRTLVIANLAGDHLVRAFQDDLDYFPELETIQIEPRNQSVGPDIRQFSQKDFDVLLEICQRRSVTVVEGATPISRKPNHCWVNDF